MQYQKGENMPHIVIKMKPGRSDSLKTEIAQALAQALVSSAGVPEKAVSVAIEEVEADDWMTKVYEPEIAGKADTLVRKPSYGSLAK
ncbi:tautomerase family protein [Rhodoferax sediminis]|uniref:4-oxalocrotonate tautomerase n=1 Tax=Rhodoferax sediminis TaxID=2509614 RepID=A0A515DDV3_9BURK|nr:tautomerase family protein [Rhodoferax sediminis]QDL38593.1 4-oxalocrotonate tautomerase [Rhodoferax sediminis]